MTLLSYLCTRILLGRARHHAEKARRLWLVSEEHHRRAGACLERLEAGIAEGRILISA